MATVVVKVNLDASQEHLKVKDVLRGWAPLQAAALKQLQTNFPGNHITHVEAGLARNDEVQYTISYNFGVLHPDNLIPFLK